MFLVLTTLWLIRETKAILFWLYLWQLKEYHIGHFLDHFQTEKGKQLIFNKVLGLKLVFLLVFFIYSVFLPYALLVLYLLELAKAFKDFVQKKLKIPVLTKKTVFLISSGLLVEILVLLLLFLNVKNIYGFAFWLLVFDILTPFIISIIVLLFQPLAVLGRNRIIKKAKKKRESFQNLLVIGITGSYGKTSTKEFLTTILSQKYNVLKTLEHQNSEVGISQCILNDLKSEHEIFIVEMGAYNRGGIKLLCNIAKPKIGILTGINEQHMATFGSLENTICTKFELIESLPIDGIAIFNGNNPYCSELYEKIMIKKRVYSLQSLIYGSPPDLWAHNVKAEKDFVTFRAISKDGDSAEFKVNVLGAHNVLDILGATAVAKELGMTLEEIAEACRRITPQMGAMKLLKGINGLNIIDSTYSANPDGVISALEYLKIWPQKKVIVMPCLIELGKASKEVHKRIGQKIGEVCDLAIITTKDRFKEIQEGASSALFIENPKEIFEKIKSFCREDDVVLLESRLPRELIKELIINNQ